MLETFANLADAHSYRTGFISDSMAGVFQPSGWRNTNYECTETCKLSSSYRLRWGLSQKELAYLFGCDRPDVISRIEKKQRAPTLALAMACFILFDTQAAELFPDISAGIEHLVMARVQEMYETIQGDPSRRTKKKLDLLEDAIARADRRKRASSP